MKAQSLNCSELPLKSALDWNAEPALAQAVIEHLDACHACRQRVEAMAATQDEWKEANQMLVDGLDNCEPSKNVGIEALAIQLLEPARHPELLGRLGRYDIERLIGSGGMGVVFKGFDTELNRPVAIKVLSPHLAASGSARQRFAREARAAAAVVHEHVVPIYNVESSGQTPLLVMQYIAGESLQARIDREGPLELEEILRIGMQVAAGLAAAHAQGLIHRDVKPGNILLDHNVARAALTDFGLAHAQDDACLTRSGLHPGTPEYMSPEQVRGAAIDARSDLFSLGSVLYCLCTGHPPFRAPGAYAVMRRITDETPRSIVQQNSRMPAWFESIVMKLLEKTARHRFSSASEVASVLAACLSHVQQPAINPLPLPFKASKARHRYSRSIAVIATLCGVVGIFPVALMMWQDPPADPSPNKATNSSAAPQVAESDSANRPTLQKLLAILSEIEQSYWPFEIKTEEIHQFQAINSPLSKPISFDHKKTFSQSLYIQADLETCLRKRIESGVQTTVYKSADEWFELEGPADGSTPPKRLSMSNPPNRGQIASVLPLEGIFQPEVRGPKFLSQAIADGSVFAKLTWDKEDAVLDAQLVNGSEVRLRLWLSRAHGWHPIQMKRFWTHDANDPFAEWQATKLIKSDGHWRVVEGTVRDWRAESERRNGLLEKLKYQTDFTVTQAKYGPQANITITRPDDGSPKVGDEVSFNCKDEIGKQFLKKYTLNADSIADFANLRTTSIKAFVERVEPTHIVLATREFKERRTSSNQTLPALPALRLRVARSRIEDKWTPKGVSTDKQEHRWKSVELNEFDLDMIEVIKP